MKMLNFYSRKNGVEVKSDEEEIFKMEVDGILEDVRDITNNDFYERWSSHLSLLNQKSMSQMS